MRELSIKNQKLKSLRNKCEQLLKVNPLTQTISIRVPRYDIKEEEEICYFKGIPCEIVSRNTCCVVVVIPLEQLYKKLNEIEL